MTIFTKWGHATADPITYTQGNQVRIDMVFPKTGNRQNWAVLTPDQARQLRQQLAATLVAMGEPVDHA